jgi:hypothetical protein
MADILTMKEHLTILFEKISTIYHLLKEQTKKFEEIRKENPSANHEDLLIAQQKSIRTSFELLRDEVDELVNISILLCKKAKKAEEEVIEESH